MTFTHLIGMLGILLSSSVYAAGNCTPYTFTESPKIRGAEDRSKTVTITRRECESHYSSEDVKSIKFLFVSPQIGDDVYNQRDFTLNFNIDKEASELFTKHKNSHSSTTYAFFGTDRKKIESYGWCSGGGTWCKESGVNGFNLSNLTDGASSESDTAFFSETIDGSEVDGESYSETAQKTSNGIHSISLFGSYTEKKNSEVIFSNASFYGTKGENYVSFRFNKPSKDVKSNIGGTIFHGIGAWYYDYTIPNENGTVIAPHDDYRQDPYLGCGPWNKNKDATLEILTIAAKGAKVIPKYLKVSSCPPSF